MEEYYGEKFEKVEFEGFCDPREEEYHEINETETEQAESEEDGGTEGQGADESEAGDDSGFVCTGKDRCSMVCAEDDDSEDHNPLSISRFNFPSFLYGAILAILIGGIVVGLAARSHRTDATVVPQRSIIFEKLEPYCTELERVRLKAILDDGSYKVYPDGYDSIYNDETKIRAWAIIVPFMETQWIRARFVYDPYTNGFSVTIKEWTDVVVFPSSGDTV